MARPWLRWLIGLLVLALLATAALRLYAPVNPWQAYATATRHYLALGLEADSATLAAQTLGAEPSAWVLAARRQDSALVRIWARSLKARAGRRTGDTVLVSLETNSARGCQQLRRLTAGFLERGGTRQLFLLQSPCVEGFGPAAVAPIEFQLGPDTLR
jgi:hypothetical protein